MREQLRPEALMELSNYESNKNIKAFENPQNDPLKDLQPGSK
jgi:hypothetical protein